jgi:2-phosphoglycerate kinase
MAITVRDPVDDSSVPFLRGILTRSLQQAGMPFEDAYGTADRIRKDLGPDAEITTSRLAELVLRHLRKQGFDEIAEQYEQEKQPIAHTIVLDRDGQPQPFSKSRLAQSLEVCALRPERTFQITVAIERRLVRKGVHELTSNELAGLTHRLLERHESADVARRYAMWLEFSRSGRPLILLVGGTTGSGKSTIGAEIAHRLNIVRTQSTDMLREVMRLMIPDQLLPALHVSSFSAWKTLPAAVQEDAKPDSHELEQGYLIQSEQVAVALEGVIRRAETENLSLILEGIHVHPAIQDRLRSSTEAILVPMILAVLKRKQLRKHLKGRGHQVSARRAERYLDHFDEIWQLQSMLLREADEYDIPIIPNSKEEDTIKLVMDTIIGELSRELSGNLERALSMTGS